jgi:hypothetical protein
MISRRDLIWLVLASGVCFGQTAAYADKGDSGGDSDGGGGNSGPGGGGNSGPGGGGDDNNDQNDGDDDHDEDTDSSVARDAVRNDNAASLKEILAVVKSKYDGDVVKVSLRGNGAGLTYRIKMLGRNSRLFEVQINAVSRKITRTKGL